MTALPLDLHEDIVEFCAPLPQFGRWEDRRTTLTASLGDWPGLTSIDWYGSPRQFLNHLIPQLLPEQIEVMLRGLTVDDAGSQFVEELCTRVAALESADAQTTTPTPELNRLEQSINYTYWAVDAVDALVRTVKRLTPTLQQHPDLKAYHALVSALDEVVNTWKVTDDAFEEVWSLYAKDGDLRAVSQGLSNISDFELSGLVEEKRGHCSAIDDFYESVLQEWIRSNPAIDRDDREKLANVFAVLGQADSDIFYNMVMVAAETERVANQVLRFVEDGQPDAARKVAAGLRRAVSPLRGAINRSMLVLKRLQKQFMVFVVEVPGTVVAGWSNALLTEFQECLIDAYNYDRLSSMLLGQLSKRLDVLVAPGSFEKVVYDLILISNEKGWIKQLVQAAATGNSTNQRLAAFSQRIEAL